MGSMSTPAVRGKAPIGPGDALALGAVVVAAPAMPVLAAAAFGAAMLRTDARRRVDAGIGEVPFLLPRLSMAALALAAAGGRATAWLATVVVALVVSSLGRSIEVGVRRRRLARTGGGERTIVVGEPTDVNAFAQLLAQYPEHGIRPVATATPDGGAPTVLPGGSLHELDDLVRAQRATHIVVATPALASAVEAVLGRRRPVGVRVSVLPPLASILTTDVEVLDVRGLPLVSLPGRRAPKGASWIAKRVFDYFAAALALVAVLPLFLVVGLAVKLDSPGPVFFRQKRIGRDGRLFEIWKFRSMVVDAEDRLADLVERNEADGPYFKLADDPRVTRVGRFLRATSLDELPQLFNVLAGHMSLVGPRPFLARELEAAPEHFEWRMGFLPGVTGLWQVAGRSWLPAEEGLRMDLAYLEHWSLGLDLKVLWRTAGTVFAGSRRPSPRALDDRVGLDRNRYRNFVLDDDLQPVGGDVDLSIVVVTHESAGDIRECLDSLAEVLHEVDAEVIVVDNASTDGTADIVSAAHPEVRLIRKRARHGFSINCNIGAAAASGRHVMLLNPDTETRPGALRALVDYLDRHPEVGAVGPRLVFPDGSLQASARRFPELASTIVRRTPLRTVMRSSEAERRHLLLDAHDERVRDADWLLGAAIAVRGEAFRRLGGFDDGYRLYCEDIDLCWRLHEDGWAVRYLPSAVIQHDLGELTRKRFLTVRTVWHFRSMARFVRLHGLGRPERGHVIGPVPARVVAPAAVGALAA
jgi:exopolysaccharide biosynthesis polyprenyl glycosylphosphotransferase